MQTMLTKERFLAARNYILREGRPLEQALFRNAFEEGDLMTVMDALAGHQMPDGGFRDMGEGDKNTSSPMGSTIAFQHLAELGVKPNHPIVRKGIDYFLSTYNHEYNAWFANEEDPAKRKNELELKWGNPNAEIVACLIRYRDLVPPSFLKHVTHDALDRFRKLPDPVPWFCDLCYLRLADALPNPAESEEIYKKITAGVRHNLELDHKLWQTRYFMKPYWFAMHPGSRLYSTLREEIQACLDFDIHTQEPDGSAFLTFRVSDDKARRTWKSIWTLESLKVLRNYGRIEGMKSSTRK